MRLIEVGGDRGDNDVVYVPRLKVGKEVAIASMLMCWSSTSFGS